MFLIVIGAPISFEEFSWFYAVLQGQFIVNAFFPFVTNTNA